MTLPKDYIIQVTAGDKYQLVVDYKTEAGVAVDLTGMTITCKIYAEKVLVLTLASGSGLTITPLTGRIVIDLIDSQTTLLVGKKSIRHVLRIDSTDVTLMVGKVEVYQNV